MLSQRTFKQRTDIGKASDIETAPAYRFNVFHTVAINDPCAPFPIDYETI